MACRDVEKGNGEELTVLNTTPGSAEDQNQNQPKAEYYRKLAFFSIICGCSCVGYKALENSFQAEYMKESEPEKAKRHSQMAKKYGILSIVTLFGIIIAIPLLVVLVSYLLTLKD